MHPFLHIQNTHQNGNGDHGQKCCHKYRRSRQSLIPVILGGEHGEIGRYGHGHQYHDHTQQHRICDEAPKTQENDTGDHQKFQRRYDIQPPIGKHRFEGTLDRAQPMISIAQGVVIWEIVWIASAATPPTRTLHR